MTRPQICGREDAARRGSVLGDADLERCVGRAIAFQCAIDEMNAPIHLGSKIMSWVTARMVRPETLSTRSRRNPKHLLGGFGIQRSGRFVGQDQSRVVGERAAQRPRAGAARRTADQGACRYGLQAQNEAKRSPARRLCARGTACPAAHGQHDIFAGGELRQQEVKLEDEPKLGKPDARALIGRHFMRWLSLHQHIARCRHCREGPADRAARICPIRTDR
jgi:hypothetical protein